MILRILGSPLVPIIAQLFSKEQGPEKNAKRKILVGTVAEGIA